MVNAEGKYDCRKLLEVPDLKLKELGFVEGTDALRERVSFHGNEGEAPPQKPRAICEFRSEGFADLDVTGVDELTWPRILTHAQALPTCSRFLAKSTQIEKAGIWTFGRLDQADSYFAATEDPQRGYFLIKMRGQGENLHDPMRVVYPAGDDYPGGGGHLGDDVV